MQMPEAVRKVMQTLQEHGYEAFLVGGCVRDFLLGKKPKDYDIATSARPEQVQNMFAHTVPTGIAHGTVLVVEDGVPVEVTTFRQDGRYEDHRHPDAVHFVSTIEEDLSRRDFTVNAMAWNPARGLIDPFGGQQDLQDKKIRAVGDPDTRFQEDALRMIRAWRFAARLGFDIEETTLQALKRNERLIDDVAVERITPEFEEILRTNPQVIDQMTGLMKKWLPELDLMLHTDQNSPYHYTDVLHHTLDALSQVPVKDPEVLWALLLHDTGKPASKTTDENGDHFKKHPAVSARIARRVVRDLKMNRRMQKDIPDLVLYHDAFYAPKPANLYKVMVERGWDEEKLNRLFAVQTGDILAHTSHERMNQLHAFRQYCQQEKKRRPFDLKDVRISGDDIVRHTSLKGAQIGAALHQLHKIAFYDPEKNTHEILLAQLPVIEKQLLAQSHAGNADAHTKSSRFGTEGNQNLKK